MSPLPLRMMSHSTEIRTLPPTWYNVDIALILKPDRDDTGPASYRPVSMLNMDFKIFTKIFANRLNQHIETLIHSDQTGFIPNRYFFFNTRPLINIMHYKYPTGSKQVILCLDAEKAFDQVEWRYLFRVLESFGLGDTFPSWIRMAFF